VGLELAQLTGFRLFHNHMTVDPVMRLFPFDSPAYRRLVTEFRRRIFEEFAATNERGLIENTHLAPDAVARQIVAPFKWRHP
jgi:hypothetical protein